MTEGGAKTAIHTSVLLVVRGLLLWFVLPLSFMVWLVALPVRLVRRIALGKRHPSLRSYLEYADHLLVAALERSVLRPFATPEPLPAWPTPTSQPGGSPVFDAW